jgi:hypothetical protein
MHGQGAADPSAAASNLKKRKAAHDEEDDDGEEEKAIRAMKKKKKTMQAKQYIIASFFVVPARISSCWLFKNHIKTTNIKRSLKPARKLAPRERPALVFPIPIFLCISDSVRLSTTNIRGSENTSS